MTRVYWAFLAIGATMMWAAGCQEEQVSSDVKQSRLIAAEIAAENRDLKARLQQEAKKHDEEIKNLNTQMQTGTKKRDDEIKNLKTEAKKRDEEIKNHNSQMQTEKKKRDDAIKNLNTQLQTEIKKRDEEIKNHNSQMQTEKKKRDDAIKNLNTQLQAEKKKYDDDISKVKAQLQDEIKNLKEQSLVQIAKQDKEIQQFSDQLTQCEQIKSAVMQREAAVKEVWGLVMDLGHKNAELSAEVDRLKAELAKAKGEK
jgi:DNA repair exonuclease SbcCD ATPase subunit